MRYEEASANNEDILSMLHTLLLPILDGLFSLFMNAAECVNLGTAIIQDMALTFQI